MLTMFGWSRRAASRASLRNISTNCLSRARWGRIRLRQTSFSNPAAPAWRARYTSAMPPEAISRTSLYLPMGVVIAPCNATARPGGDLEFHGRFARSRSVCCTPSSLPESADASTACAPFPCRTASSLRRAPSMSWAALAMSCWASSQARSARNVVSSATCAPVRPGSALARSTSAAAVRSSPFFPAFLAQLPSRSKSQRSSAFCSSNSVSAGGLSPAGIGNGAYTLSVGGSGEEPVGKKRPRSITSALPRATARKRCSFRSDASHQTVPNSAAMTTQRMNRCNPPPLFGTLCSAILEDPDEGNVAVLVAVVEPVAHHEAVLDLEPEVVDGDPGPRPRRLVQQRAQLHGRGPAGGEVVEQVPHGESGIDDVLDDQDVLGLDGLGEVAGDLHHAGRLRRLPVAGEPDEIDGQRQVDGSGQIGDEDVGALQHAEQHQLFALIVPLDPRAQLANPVRDLLRGKHLLQFVGQFHFGLLLPVNRRARRARRGGGGSNQKISARSARSAVDL